MADSVGPIMATGMLSKSVKMTTFANSVKSEQLALAWVGVLWPPALLVVSKVVKKRQKVVKKWSKVVKMGHSGRCNWLMATAANGHRHRALATGTAHGPPALARWPPAPGP